MSQQNPYGPFPQAQYPPQPPPKKHTVRNVILAGLGAFAVMVGGCTALLAGTTNPADTAGDKPTEQVTTGTVRKTDPPPATTAPTTAPSRPAPKAAPTKAPPKLSVKPTPPAPKPAPVVFRKITSRQWKLIAKSPDAHIGERIIVHGRVSQFDAATGTDAFRADVDGVKHRPSYGFVDYPTNVVLTGDESALTDLVEDDLFTAMVTVTGSLSYDTQIGGETTVPKLQIASITVTGSVAD